jgi:hypothetical protein
MFDFVIMLKKLSTSTILMEPDQYLDKLNLNKVW